MKFNIEKNENFEFPTLTPILDRRHSSDRLTLLIFEISIPENPYIQSFILSARSEYLGPFLSLIYSTLYGLHVLNRDVSMILNCKLVPGVDINVTVFREAN